MHDNPQTVPDAAFTLPGHRIVTLTGRDAAAFAQAQFSSDVALLEPGHWHWSAWLTPKGRVVALFALLKLDGENVWLLLPDAEPQGLADALRRFVFRSKVSVDVPATVRCTAAFAAPERASGSRFDGDAVQGLELDLSGNGGHRRLRIGIGGADRPVVEGEDPASDEAAGPQARWTAFDLQHGLPRLAAAQAERWTPQQLSLERLQAFSVRKGCYPGQEIVARTHFLGKAKRGLALLEADASIAAGDAVAHAGQPVGEVVSAAPWQDDHRLALAVMPSDLENSDLMLHGRPALLRPLLGGLAR